MVSEAGWQPGAVPLDLLRRAAARSSSVVPPQMPWSCPVRTANTRHSRLTRQAAQIALAAAACSRAGPDAETGKNSSGSADRQAAADRHCPWVTVRVVQDSSETPRTRLTSSTPAGDRSIAVDIIQFTGPDRGGTVGAGSRRIVVRYGMPRERRGSAWSGTRRYRRGRGRTSGG